MSYEEQKKYFEQSYTTGSDIWTHIPYEKRGLPLLSKLPKNSLILDVGSGRGMWSFELAEMGYRVIGIDYAKNAVDKANNGSKDRGLEGKIKFVEGDVLNMPFKESTFDAVVDFGLMQHLHKNDWDKYIKEVSRVTRTEGFFLKVVFSKETTSFLGFNPKESETADFEKDGIHYHFFTKEEIAEIFEKNFEIIEQKIEAPSKKDVPIFISTLMKKK
ncbi:MAG: class I SAM-dependent methyltransferase [Candidatus Marinimicrobia bacterium]|nr:class I SAM-dependent methyltransferase [Candidatus Neomarinimicrobiota bacterium]